MKLIRLYVAALAVTLLACGGHSDNHVADHNCPVISENGFSGGASWGWLILHHDDSRSCPYLAGIGVYVSAGGIITQVGNVVGAIDSATSAMLTIHHTSYGCAESAFGDTVVTVQSNFSRAFWLNDAYYHWGTGVWASLLSGQGPDPNRDCAMFRVTLPRHSERPVAVTMLNYTEMW